MKRLEKLKSLLSLAKVNFFKNISREYQKILRGEKNVVTCRATRSRAPRPLFAERTLAVPRDITEKAKEVYLKQLRKFFVPEILLLNKSLKASKRQKTCHITLVRLQRSMEWYL